MRESTGTARPRRKRSAPSCRDASSKCAVAAGDRVEARSLLLVLEAMKMQNEIRTVRGGLVTRVLAEAGKVVDGGALLAVVVPDEGLRPPIQ